MRLALILITAAGFLSAQTETRGIVPEEVLKARPQPAKSAPAVSRPRYQPIDPQALGSLRPGTAVRQVGVTIWRLRPAAAGDSGARILVQEEARTEEWVPERIASSSSLNAGDRVRLSVESPEAGYLYVIDRERYASGERGDPYLIFPTSRTHNGDNRVTGGRLVDIPAQDDRPSFFTLRRSRADQTEEELTMLLTQEPIEGLEIGPKAILLKNEQVAGWEKQFGASKVERFELSGGTGKTWTRAEQQSAADATRLLTQDDPPPQTIYRVASNPGERLMVKVRLRYAAGHGK
jgi:Domain of unknown function (DUF4384)